MSTMLEAALDYALRSWPIFPCNKDKEPLVEGGVLSATTNTATIRKWWEAMPDANIGLDVGGAGMMALDLDPGHDLGALEAAIGTVPVTNLSQRTPRGGRHLFFALEPGEIVAPSASKLAPHVDVRSFHSYVLLAPSVTKDGAYTWEGDHWPAPKPAKRSAEMVRVANAGKEKHGDRDNWLIAPDMPEHVARCVDWLKRTAKVAVQGQGGDHTAYATAAMCKSFGVSPELAIDLMVEHWNPRCMPPWGEGELDHLTAKVEHAYSYNTSPPGNMTDAYHKAKALQAFKPVARELEQGNETTAGRFRVVDLAGMQEIQEPTWLVPNLITEGAYGLLIAPASSFKSFIALDIALSVATGHGANWAGIRKPGPVLYVAGEGRSGIKARVNAWRKFNQIEAAPFFLLDPVPNMGKPEEIETFIKLALHINPDGYRLVCLDTVGRSFQGVDENAQQHASMFTAMVERFQKEMGATVLGLHHTGHGAKDRARGSSVFGADADMVIIADREFPTTNVTLTMPKQKEAPEWPEPRTAKLVEIGKTLVFTGLSPVKAQTEAEALNRNGSYAAKPAQVSRDTTSGRSGGRRGPETRISLDLVDLAGYAELKEARTNERISTSDFALRIARRLQAGDTFNIIRSSYLPKHIACTPRFKCFEHYDKQSKRWLQIA